MFKQWYPDVMAESAFTIDYQEYYDNGYRGVLFDTDNTLVDHDAPANDRARKLVSRLKLMGFKVCIISNNNERRVRSFSEDIGADYIYDAKKPEATGFLKAMDMLGLEASETFMVGDQLFTDIWGAHRAGILAVFVKPIGEEIVWRIKLKRIGEKVVFWVKGIMKK